MGSKRLAWNEVIVRPHYRAITVMSREKKWDQRHISVFTHPDDVSERSICGL